MNYKPVEIKILLFFKSKVTNKLGKSQIPHDPCLHEPHLIHFHIYQIPSLYPCNFDTAAYRPIRTPTKKYFYDFQWYRSK